jgi:hypothetical protein
LEADHADRKAVLEVKGRLDVRLINAGISRNSTAGVTNQGVMQT